MLRRKEWGVMVLGGGWGGRDERGGVPHVYLAD